MQIKKGQAKDISAILTMTEACDLAMRKQGIVQWNEGYPSREAFEKDSTRGELYILEKENRICGCITISTHMDAEYEPVQWLTPDDTRHVYVHRLAVHPEYQGKGYARKLMDFAEERALKDGCISIRLDTFSKNLRNMRFYEARGYRKLEAIFLPAQSTHPFYCYEKILSS